MTLNQSSQCSTLICQQRLMNAVLGQHMILLIGSLNMRVSCLKNFGDRVKYWLTINEQNMLTLVGPVIGTLHVPEGTTNLTKEIYQQIITNWLRKLKQCNFAMKCFPMLKLVQHQIFLWFTQRHQNQKMLLLLKLQCAS